MHNIIQQASGKSYLFIIIPNSHDKFITSNTDVRLESVQKLLKLTRLAYRKSYLIIIGLKSCDKLTNSVIRSSWSNIDQKHSTSLCEVISAHY